VNYKVVQIKKTIQYIFVFLPLLLLIIACGNDNNDSQEGIIPNVQVNFFLQPDGLDFIPVGGFRYYDYEGYRGVLIYRVDQFNFNAFERTCPYDPLEECAQVEVDQSGILLIDSCCMSQYSILDGMPAGGPTNIPLKQYFTSYDGTTLQVYNSQ